MFSDEIRTKLENTTKGIVIEEHGDSCATVRNLLCRSFKTSTTVKKDFESKSISKKEQVKFLTQLANKHNLWILNLPDKEKFLAEGGEAKIFGCNRSYIASKSDAVSNKHKAILHKKAHCFYFYCRYWNHFDCIHCE